MVVLYTTRLVRPGGQLLRSYGKLDHPLKVSLRTSFAGLRAFSADDAYSCFFRDAAAMQAHYFAEGGRVAAVRPERDLPPSSSQPELRVLKVLVLPLS